jgi:hypothetical protein
MTNRKTHERKTFDAVRLMRDLRETIRRETEEMSYEEEKAYIRKRLKREATSSHGDFPKWPFEKPFGVCYQWNM